jgi:predicted N-formylglutamate amidohydrolase
MTDGASPVVVVENPDPTGSFVILCDHASNRIPQEFESFGFAPDALETHIAWTLALWASRGSSRQSLMRRFSGRMLPASSSTAIVRRTQARSSSSKPRGAVNANRGLSEEERKRRLEHIHACYHAEIEACLSRRVDAGVPTAIIAIHSFTPSISATRAHGRWDRIWGGSPSRRSSDPRTAIRRRAHRRHQRALLPRRTRSSATPVRRACRRLIEIRNDDIGDEAGQRYWADPLARTLQKAETVNPPKARNSKERP